MWSIKLVNSRFLRNNYLLLPQLLSLLQLFGPLAAGCLVVGPVRHLALFRAVPCALALRAALECLFLALGALEAFSESLNVVVGVQIGQFHHMSPLAFVHALLKPFEVQLCQFLPVSSLTDLRGDDWYLLHNERVGSEVCGHVHDGKFLKRAKHVGEIGDLIEQHFIEEETYAEESVLALVVDFVLLVALRTHEEIENGDPYLRLRLRQLAIIRFGDDAPLAVLEDLPFSLLGGLEPGPFLDKRHEHREDIALDEQVMQDAYLKVFDVVSDVPDDRYAHYEDFELDVFDLAGEFFLGSAFEDLAYCDFSLFLFGHLAALALQLTLQLPPLHAVCHLLRDLFVAVVDDFDEEVPAFVDGCPVEHEGLEYVADDRLVVDGEIQLK